jgi:hypothetical protein
LSGNDGPLWTIEIDVRLHAVLESLREIRILRKSFDYQMLYPGMFKGPGNLGVGSFDPRYPHSVISEVPFGPRQDPGWSILLGGPYQRKR